MSDDTYVRPYFDSGVFISWVKGTDIPEGDTVDRTPISTFVLEQGEAGKYPIITSYFTIAEVFKKRGDGRATLTDEQDGKILAYFENEFITFVTVDRIVAEMANRLCVKYRSEKLLPPDAIHLASALRAGCDVLVTWDGPLTRMKHSEAIRIEFPKIGRASGMPLFDPTE